MESRADRISMKDYQIVKVIWEKTTYILEIQASDEQDALKKSQDSDNWEAVKVDTMATFDPTVEEIKP
jgi:hypothetical protein